MSLNKLLVNTIAKNFAWIFLGCLMFAGLSLLPGVKAQAVAPSTAYVAAADTFNLGEKANGDTCGGSSDAIKTSVDIGCQGKGNAIMDMMFAFIRFLSYGAGLAIVGSLVYAGIHYSASRGDPQAVSLAKTRLQNVVMALFLFIFSYAILNYLIPEQLLK